MSFLASVNMNRPGRDDEEFTIDLSSSSQMPPEMREVHDFMKEAYPGESSDAVYHLQFLPVH